MKKNILFYCNVVLWKHQLSGFLRIVEKEIKKKNRIYLLFCDSTLESCPPNNKKMQIICSLCQKHQSNIYQKYFDKKVNLINLDLRPEKIKKSFYFKNFEEFKAFKFDNAPLGMLVSSDLITFFRDSNLIFKEVKEIATKKLISSILLYKKSLEVIKKNKIDVVYSWNGRRGSDGPLLYSAKKLNKEYYNYIVSTNSEDMKIGKSLIVHDLKTNKNDIKSINLKKTFKNKGKIEKYLKKNFEILSKGKLLKTNFKNFNYIKKKDYLSLDYKKNKRLITIFTSTLWEHSSLGEDWNLKFDYKKTNFLDLLDKIVNEKKILKFNDIIIKWHPNHIQSSVNEMHRIKNFIKKNNHIKHYSYHENISIYDLMNISDNVITFGSTTGVEYSYMKSKKVILIGPSYYEDLSFAKRCKNMKQLIFSINNNLRLENKSIFDFAKFIFWSSEPPSSIRVNSIHFPKSVKILLKLVGIIKNIEIIFAKFIKTIKKSSIVE